MSVQLDEELEKVGGEHGEIGAILSRHLANHVYDNNLGRVFNAQTSFKIGGSQPSRQPDVSFVSLAKMPFRIKGDIPFAPDLAVEVVSQSDILAELDQRIDDYLQAGVGLVWVVRPSRQIVEVYHLNNPVPVIIGPADELNGEDVLQGFKLAVSKLFE